MTNEQILADKKWFFASNDEMELWAQKMVADGKLKNIKSIHKDFPWSFTYVLPDCRREDLFEFFKPELLE